MNPQQTKVSGEPKRLGLFGGSFDPVHIGHLLIARDALEQCELDALWWIPSAQNPHKTIRPEATAAARLRMLQAAIDGIPGMSVWTGELEGGDGPSYTYQTIRRIRDEIPTSRLFWLMGQDQLARLDDWYRIGDLVGEVEFAVYHRSGAPENVPEIPGVRCHWLAPRRIDVSSTEIRDRRRSGKPIDFYTLPAVMELINQMGLYKNNAL